MSYRLKVTFPRPDPDDTYGHAKGFGIFGCMVAATWDDEHKKQVGWVVREGAEKYGREFITPLGFEWEVVEYEV